MKANWKKLGILGVVMLFASGGLLALVPGAQALDVSGVYLDIEAQDSLLSGEDFNVTLTARYLDPLPAIRHVEGEIRVYYEDDVSPEKTITWDGITLSNSDPLMDLLGVEYRFENLTVNVGTLQYAGNYRVEVFYEVFNSVWAKLGDAEFFTEDVLQRIHLLDFSKVYNFNYTHTYTGGTNGQVQEGNETVDVYNYTGGTEKFGSYILADNFTVRGGKWDNATGVYQIRGGSPNGSNYDVVRTRDEGNVLTGGSALRMYVDFENPPRDPRTYNYVVRDTGRNVPVLNGSIDLLDEENFTVTLPQGLRDGSYEVRFDPDGWTQWNPSSPQDPFSTGLYFGFATVRTDELVASNEDVACVRLDTTASCGSGPAHVDYSVGDTISFYSTWGGQGALSDQYDLTFRIYRDDTSTILHSATLTNEDQTSSQFVTSWVVSEPGTFRMYANYHFETSLSITTGDCDTEGGGSCVTANTAVGWFRANPVISNMDFYKSDYATTDSGVMVGESTYFRFDVDDSIPASGLISDTDSVTDYRQEVQVIIKDGTTQVAEASFALTDDVGSQYRAITVTSGTGSTSRNGALEYRVQYTMPNTFNDGTLNAEFEVEMYSGFSGQKFFLVPVIEQSQGVALATGSLERVGGWQSGSYLTLTAPDGSVLRATTTNGAWAKETFSVRNEDNSVDFTESPDGISSSTPVRGQWVIGYNLVSGPSTGAGTFELDFTDSINRKLVVTIGGASSTTFTGSFTWNTHLAGVGTFTHTGAPTASPGAEFDPTINWDEENYRISYSNDLALESVSSSLGYVNRGESPTLSGTIKDAWGETMDNYAFNLDVSSGSTDYDVGSATTDGTGQFSIAWDVPANADDTYASGTHSQSETKDYSLHVHFPSTVTDSALGSYGAASAVLDVDSQYYNSVGTQVSDAQLNRADSTDITASFVGVRGQGLPATSDIDYVIRDGADAIVATGTHVDAGSNFNVEWAVANADPAGSYDVGLEIQGGDPGNNGNSYAQTFTNALMEIREDITVTSMDIDVAGEATSKYFHRGETVRLTGVLKDAWNNEFYAFSDPDGDRDRQVEIHLYHNTLGSAGSVTSAAATVNRVDGTFSVDIVIPTDATDSYVDALPSVAEATEWDVHVFDTGATATGSTHNRGTQVDLFDVDSQYYSTGAPVVSDNQLNRLDSTDITGAFSNVRSVAPPAGVDVNVYLRNPSGTDVATLTTTDGAGQFDVEWQATASDATGLYDIGREIPDFNGNSVTKYYSNDKIEVRDTITVSSIDIDVAGEATSKYFNRGETVRVTGVLKDAWNNEFYAFSDPDGDTDRSVKFYLYHDSFTANGAVESTSAVVNRVDGTFTVDITLPSDASDTYASTTPNVAEATEWDYEVYDAAKTGPTATDYNQGRLVNGFDVDSGVYITNFYTNDDNTDADDLDLNSGDSDNLDVNTAYQRIHVTDVRGDSTNQFNSLSLDWEFKNPFNGAQDSAGNTAFTSQAGGLYTQSAAFNPWVTHDLAYTVQSADTNGNTNVYGDSTETAIVHHLIGRVTRDDNHVLVSQSVNVTTEIMDSYDDRADNGVIDFSAAAYANPVIIEQRDVHDNNPATLSTHVKTSAAFTSGSSFNYAYVAGDEIDWRDIRTDIQDGHLAGLEWADEVGDYNQHSRQGVDDNDGVFLVDDLVVSTIVTDKATYLPGETVQGTVAYAFTHPSLNHLTPVSESYAYFENQYRRTWDNALMNVPAYADANTDIPTATDASGETSFDITLTSIAQIGDYYFEADTNAETQTSGFEVLPVVSASEWYAHPNSDDANPYIVADQHNRGETVKLTVTLQNNPEGFTPSSSSATDDDVEGEVLDAAAVWDAGTDSLEFEWFWDATDAASPTGVAHTPVVDFTLNGVTAATAPTSAADLFNTPLIDIHYQQLDTLQKDEIGEEIEDHEFFIALHVVYYWVHIENIRGEDWAGFTGDYEIRQVGSLTVKDSGSFTTGADGWTTRLEYPPEAPIGEYSVYVTGTYHGNDNDGVEHFEIFNVLSPNTDEFVLRGTGASRGVRQGTTHTFQLHTQRYDKDNRTLYDYVPDDGAWVTLEWSDDGASWTRFVDESATALTATSFEYEWVVPTGGEWVDREISISWNATFKGATVWLTQDTFISTSGGSAFIVVDVAPVIANAGETVTFTSVQKGILGEPRTGNAAGTTTTVVLPDDSEVTLNSAVEVVDGVYVQAYTLNATPLEGGYTFIVETTHPVLLQTVSQGGAFFVEEDATALLKDYWDDFNATEQELNQLVQSEQNATESYLDYLYSQRSQNIDGVEAGLKALINSQHNATRANVTEQHDLTRQHITAKQQQLLAEMVALDEDWREYFNTYWGDFNATWDYWLALYSVSGDENYDNLTEFIEERHNVTVGDLNEAQQGFFNQTAVQLVEYSRYIVSGVGEEVLINRDILKDTEEQSRLGLLWDAVAVDGLKWGLYGLIVIIMLVLFGNRRARKILKKIPVLGGVANTIGEWRKKRKRRRNPKSKEEKVKAIARKRDSALRRAARRLGR